MSADIIPFPAPVPSSCSGATIPGLTTAELRQRARDGFYSAERRAGTDPLTAYDRAEAFAADIERVHGEMVRQIARVKKAIEDAR